MSLPEGRGTMRRMVEGAFASPPPHHAASRRGPSPLREDYELGSRYIHRARPRR